MPLQVHNVIRKTSTRFNQPQLTSPPYVKTWDSPWRERGPQNRATNLLLPTQGAAPITPQRLQGDVLCIAYFDDVPAALAHAVLRVCRGMYFFPRSSHKVCREGESAVFQQPILQRKAVSKKTSKQGLKKISVGQLASTPPNMLQTCKRGQGRTNLGPP